jgi:F0F1-type ATP synthase assembly protein I
VRTHLQALTIILGMILVLIIGFELGKMATMEKIRNLTKEVSKQLEETAKKLKEAKGDNEE